MAAKRKRPSKGHPKRPETEVMAEVLSFAAKETLEAAEAKYGFSQRTIWRWRAAVRDGKLPEVAKLVTEIKAEAVARCKDVLTEAYEVSLRRIVTLMPTANISEATKAAEMCGGLKITKDALGGEPDSPAGQGQPT